MAVFYRVERIEEGDMMTEHSWDRLLKIRTTGRDDSRSDQYRYPYEASPYDVLERLAGSGYITKRNTLLDYGCGKGRVDFYMSYQCRCGCIGIECDDRIFQTLLKNMDTAVSAAKVIPVCMPAEKYQLPASVDRIYFFNPFSVEILGSVMERIRQSWYDRPREILLFFYYPSDEYAGWLMTVDELMFLDEIDCRDLFKTEDHRERIMVFRFG